MQIGEVLAGKFRVEKVLAAGGMGVVVLATHIALQQQVALKFLLPSALKDESAVARFEREARAAARLRSKHVVRVSDVGTMDDGQPYMVMEFLEGEDLTGVIAKGNVPVDLAIETMTQICDALAEAHKLGIVHRDLKPGNIFMTKDNNGALLVKVLDFGISKLQGDALALTSTAQIIGSPLYMSPEQLRASRDVDPRSDMWALGAILYEMLTGRVPFMADNVMELAFKVLETTPEPVSKVRDDVPAHVIAAIDACLAKNRDDRVPSPGALVRMLLAAKDTTGDALTDTQKDTSARPESAPPRSTSSEPPGGIAAATGTSWNTNASGSGRRPRSWIVAAVAVLGVGGTVAFVKAGSGTPAAPSGVPSIPTTPMVEQAADTNAPSASSSLGLFRNPSASPNPNPSASPSASVSAAPTSTNLTKATRPDPAQVPRVVKPAASVSAGVVTCTVVADGFDPDGNPKFKKVCN